MTNQFNSSAFRMSASAQLQMRAIGKPLLRKRAGASFFYQGDEWAGAYRIIVGACRYVRYDREGRRHVLGFLLPGEAGGLPLRDAYGFELEAIEETEAIWMNASDCAQADALADEVDRLTERARFLENSQVALRLAEWLDRIAVRLHAKEKGLVLPIRQKDIAAYLATTPETICRLFRQMRARKIISNCAPGRVSILDRGAIRRLATGAPCSLAA